MAEKVMVSFELDNAQAIKAIRKFNTEMGEGVPKATEKANKGFNRLSKNIGNLAGVLGLAAISRGVYSSVRAFADFETQMVNVQNITGLTNKEMGALAREVRALPAELGSATELMRGLYQTLSSGIPRGNAVSFLAENAKAAKGNLADLTTTINASTSVLAAYHLQTSETTAVLDAMTKTVDLGKLTFSDLAQNIGKGISIAAQAGVTYQELMATMASLTLSGLSVEEAMTGIRNILVATIKPQAGQIEMMKSLGVEMSLAAIESKGFAGYMASLAEGVQGNAAATAQLFPNIRALNSAMSLASEEGGQRFRDVLEAINESTGKVDDNFARMADTINAKTEELAAQFERLQIEFSEKAAPALIESLSKITDGLILLVDLLSFEQVNNLEGLTTQLESLDRAERALGESLKETYGSIAEGLRQVYPEADVSLRFLALYLRQQKEFNRATEEEARLIKIMDGAQSNHIRTVKQAEAAAKKLASQQKDLTNEVERNTEVVKDNIKTFKEWCEWAEKAYEKNKILHKPLVDIKDAFEKLETPIITDIQKLKEFDSTATLLQSSFADLLGKGFMGELESFADLWDAVWQDLAKSMVGILGKAIEEAFSDGGEGFGQLFGSDKGSIAETIKQNRLAAGLAGAGMMYSGYQQGGAGGVIQGMAGGAMTGLALSPGNPYAAAAGAAIGGLMALLNKEPAPRVYGNLGLGGHQVWQHDTSLTTGARAVWAQDMISQYQSSIMAMNNVLRLFEDGDLFDLIAAAPTFTFDEADLNQITAVFTERWLPDAMRSMFQNAINRGLGDIGVGAATRQQLWREVNQLGGADRITALESYISAVVNSARLIDDMDWNAILDATRQDSFSAFIEGMGNALEAVQIQMLGLDSMTLLERADQATKIEQLIAQARQAEIQYLQQIDALQQGINRSVDQQIQALRVGGMSETDAANFYADQINGILAQLRSGATSPEMVQMLMGDLQRYIGAYQGILGEDIYTTRVGGVSMADYLIGALEEARGLSNEAFESMRDQIRESNDALILELQRLIEALTNFSGGGTGDQTPPLNIDGNINIHVYESELFESWIDAKISAAWQQQTNAGIN